MKDYTLRKSYLKSQFKAHLERFEANYKKEDYHACSNDILSLQSIIQTLLRIDKEEKS